MPPIFSDGDDADTSQDRAEVLDEDNQNEADAGGRTSEMRTFEELPDVLDVTSAVGDSDDDAALIAEDLDDDEIIELQADQDMADLEDDELAARMPEAFDDDSLGLEDIEEVRLAEESTLDAREDEDEDRQSAAAADEVELSFDGDLNEADIDEADAASMEADRLDDDDIADLGYPDRNPGGANAG
jgi:hypothetical protein